MIYIWGPNGPTRSNISGITHTRVEAPPAQLLLIFKHTSPPLDSSQPSSSLFHMLLQVVLFCSVLFCSQNAFELLTAVQQKQWTFYATDLWLKLWLFTSYFQKWLYMVSQNKMYTQTSKKLLLCT